VWILSVSKKLPVTMAALRIEKHRATRCENRDIGADADGQRQNGDGRESRMAGEGAQGQAKIEQRPNLPAR
jgi:hypothetical protein